MTVAAGDTTNKAIMTAGLAVMMLALTFALVSDAPETDAAKEGELVQFGGIYYVTVYGDRTYTDSSLNNEMYIYVVGNGSDTIVADAFNGCKGIRSVYLGDDIKHIGDRAFKGTTSLDYIKGTMVETIGEDAFRGSGLDSCFFKNPLREIGDNAFRDCVDFERFRLHYTSVTSIGSGVFANCDLECLDLRKVTYIHPDAFTGSGLTLQIVTSDQQASVIGVDRMYFDGPEDFYLSCHCLRGTLTFELDHLGFLEIVDEEGNPAELTVSGQSSSLMISFQPVEGMDYYMNRSLPTVTFPDDIGLEQSVVEFESWTTTYTLPVPDIGDMEFMHWEIEGLEGEFTEITTKDLIDAGGHPVLKPVFGNAVLTFDHSGVSSYTDASDLETQALFTYGDVYPDLPDLYGYGFAGWSVDGTTYYAGDRIENHSNHTAVSLWEPSFLLELTYAGPDGTPVSETEHGYNQTVTVDPEVTLDGEDSQRFLGWSLDGATVLGPEDTIVMDTDRTLTPVFEERELFTVTFLVDDEVWDDASCYDGRTLTIDVAEPTSERIFVLWTGPDGLELKTGDVVTVASDLQLTAQWRDRDAFLLTFIDPNGETVTDYKVEGIPYTVTQRCDDTETMMFDHWTSEDGTEVAVGDIVLDDEAATFTATYRERLTFSVTYKDGETSLGTSECLEGTEFTVEAEDPVKDGMIFVGWNGSDGKHYSHGDTAVLTSDLVLTAQWRLPEELTVTLMDGEDELHVLTATEGSTLTLDIPDPEKDGKVFLCWSDDEGNEFSRGDFIMVTEDTVLSAGWRDALTFSVTYMDGDRKVSEATGTENAAFKIVQPDLSNTATKEFVGWSDGATEHHLGDTLTLTGDLVLKAVWEDIPVVEPEPEDPDDDEKDDPVVEDPGDGDNDQDDPGQDPDTPTGPDEDTDDDDGTQSPSTGGSDRPWRPSNPSGPSGTGGDDSDDDSDDDGPVTPETPDGDSDDEDPTDVPDDPQTPATDDTDTEGSGDEGSGISGTAIGIAAGVVALVVAVLAMMLRRS